MDNKDIRYVIAGVVLAAGLLLPSAMGLNWAIYVAFAYLSLNAGIMVMAAGILLNPDVFRLAIKFEGQHRNHLLQAMVNTITAVFLYKIYIDGFVFLAGFFTMMLIISIVSNTLTALAAIKREN